MFTATQDGEANGNRHFRWSSIEMCFLIESIREKESQLQAIRNNPLLANGNYSHFFWWIVASTSAALQYFCQA